MSRDGGTGDGDATRFPRQQTRYRYREKLGGGGVGEVFLAEQVNLARPVAIKVLHAHIAQDPRFVDTLRSEAITMAVVRSPRVAHVYEFVADGDPPHLVMEYVEGRTLRQILGERGRLPLAEAMTLVRSLAEALRDLHAGRPAIVHLDVKPGNLMALDEGGVKLLDLGLARARWRRARAQGGEESTVTDGHFGPADGRTPSYASPEQNAGRPVTPRSDIWSAGCILFECLAGQRPFRDGSLDASGAPAPIDWSPLSNIDVRVRKLLDHCLDPEAAGRPADGAALMAAIDAAMHAPPAAHAAGQASPLSEGRVTGHSNLPYAIDWEPLVGRERELRSIGDAFARGTRLIVLHGVSGVGKTRLALAALREWTETPPGATVCWVSLAPLPDDADESRIEAQIDRALLALDLRKSSALEDEAPADLQRRIGDRALTIALDDVDRHGLAVARVAANLLTRHPLLRVVATTVDPSPFPASARRRVEPLPAPRPEERELSLELLHGFASVALFAQCARRVAPNFRLRPNESATVAELCGLLGGIPLALELAAARLDSMTVGQIVTRLQRIIREPLEDRLGHQRSVATALNFTLSCAGEEQRRLLTRVALFEGSWTLEAAEAICGDGESSLVGELPVWAALRLLHNLGLVQVDGRGRHRLLEPMRGLATALLEASPREERAALAERRRRHFITLVSQTLPGVNPPAGWTLESWLDAMELDRDNVHAAWRACVDLPEAGEGGRERATLLATLVRSIDLFWWERGAGRDAWTLCAAALAARPQLSSSADRLGVTNACAGVAMLLRRHDDAEALYSEAHDAAAAAGDTARPPIFESNSALCALRRGDFALAISRAERVEELSVIAGLADDAEPLLQARVVRADALRRLGRFDEAVSAFSPLIETLTRRDDQRRLAEVEGSLGQIAAMRDELDSAATHLHQARARNRRNRRNDLEWSRCVLWLGIVAAREGRATRARRLLRTGRAAFVARGGEIDDFTQRALDDAAARLGDDVGAFAQMETG